MTTDLNIYRTANLLLKQYGNDGAGMHAAMRADELLEAGDLDGSRAKATGPGLYAASLFYPAVGRFHLFNTCNTWTARALAAAGFDVVDANSTKAEELMRQVRLLGKQLYMD